jgi:OOP family OmpA-OmpF porin
MKKSTTFAVLAACLATMACGTVVAGNHEGAITITPGIGYYTFSMKRDLNDTAALPTVAVAYNLTSKLAAEIAYASLPTRFDTLAGGGVVGNSYTLAGLYRFMPHGMFEPYVSAGVGILYLNPNGSSPANQAIVNLGLGSQLFFSDCIALRAEIRDLYTLSGGKNDVLYGAGVSFLIGGHAEQPMHVSYKGEAFTGDK